MSQQEASTGEHTLPTREGVVLIADDERPIAMALAYVIADLGYQPIVAVDGREALALARVTWPSLLVTDLMMPKLSGTQLIAALHTEAAAAGRAPVPTLLITAAAPQHTQDAGADAVLAKPFDLTDFEQLIQEMLDQS